MKRLIIALLIIGTTGASFAQSTKYLTAYNLVTAYNNSGAKDVASLKEAYEAINEAAAHESTRENAKTWYYRGLINQMLFENKDVKADYPNALFDAAESYKKALSLNDNKFRNEEEATTNLGNVFLLIYNEAVNSYNSKQYKDAYNNFNEAASIRKVLQPRNVKLPIEEGEAQLLTAISAEQAGMSDEAIRLMTELVAKDYQDADLYRSLARIYLNQGDKEKAKSTLATGIQKFPQDVNMRIQELNIYLEEGKATEAVDKMIKATELEPNNASLQLVLGNTYEKLGDKEKAKAAYKKAIEIDGNYYEAYNNMAALFVNGAKEIAEQMNDINLSNDKYNALDMQRKEMLKMGLPYLERSNELNPDNKETLQVLKEVYAHLGNYEKSGEIKKKLESMK